MRTGEALARAAVRAIQARFGYCERCPGVCHRLDVAAGLCSVCRRPMTPL